MSSSASLSSISLNQFPSSPALDGGARPTSLAPPESTTLPASIGYSGSTLQEQSIANRLRRLLNKELPSFIPDETFVSAEMASTIIDNREERQKAINLLCRGCDALNVQGAVTLQQKIAALQDLLNGVSKVEIHGAPRQNMINTLSSQSDIHFTHEFIAHVLPLAEAVPHLEHKSDQRRAVQWLSSLVKYLPEEKDAICKELAVVCGVLYETSQHGERGKPASLAAKKLVKRIESYPQNSMPDILADAIVGAIQKQKAYYNGQAGAGMTKIYDKKNIERAFRTVANDAQRAALE